MIDPNDYWVNNPLITPINKALMYDNAIFMAKSDGMDEAIDIFNEETKHNGKTHYYGMECWFCDTVALIRGENK